MDASYLLDPEIAPLLAFVPEGPLSAANLAERREWAKNLRPDDPAPVITPRWEQAPGRDGAPDIPLLIFDPPDRQGTTVLLYIHGGGMVMGTAEMNAPLNADLALRNDMLVVSVDYRLAPEVPFPGPQEDCYAAIAWLHAHAERLKIDTDRIIVWGDSAGGGLAAALALMVRDRGEYALRGQILIYPMLDDRTGSADCPYGNAFAGQYIWNASDNIFGWQSMRGSYGADDDKSGWLAPSRAASLAGLPPAFISTGAIDLFVDEDIHYARRLITAGVPVELHVYPGGPHGFNWVTESGIAKQFWADFHRAVDGMAQK